MKKQKNFKKVIMERFMTDEELNAFEIAYFKAKLVNIGKIKLGKSPFAF